VKTDKKARLSAISERIERFCRAGLNDEYEIYAKGLLARIVYLPRMNLQRGRPEIWAAAIVTVIARLNFLFDPANPDATTMDAICDYFGTVKNTTGNKAAAIEKGCGIRMGEPGLCREEITDRLTLVETGDGFILPMSTPAGRVDVPRDGKNPTTAQSFLTWTDVQEVQTGKGFNNCPKKPAKPKRKGAENDRQMRLFDDC